MFENCYDKAVVICYCYLHQFTLKLMVYGI
jgi:hypothetical protein